MSLKITRAAEPITVERLNMVIYGPPGIGKSSLAFTAAKPVLLDFDNGSYRTINRKDAVIISDWSDVAGMTADDLVPFKTVVVDTAGRALDSLTADIVRGNPKLGRGGALTLQGYGELKARFIAFLKLLNSFGKDVILIAHMDEQRNGDDLIERLDVQGGSKGEIYKAADAMGRLIIANGQRRLLFSPTDAAFGKNPGQLPALDVPNYADESFTEFLGVVIQRTKDRLNELTDEQREAIAEQEWFRETMPKVENAEGINALLPRAKKAGPAVSRMVVARAEELKLTFDKAAHSYADPAKESASDPEKEAA